MLTILGQSKYSIGIQSPFEESILESESVVKIFLNRILILVNEKNFHCVIEQIKFDVLILRKSL